jgi:hypothetical protein
MVWADHTTKSGFRTSVGKVRSPSNSVSQGWVRFGRFQEVGHPADDRDGRGAAHVITLEVMAALPSKPDLAEPG